MEVPRSSEATYLWYLRPMLLPVIHSMMKKVVSTLASSVCIAAFQPSDAFTQQPQFCNKAGCRRGRRCKVVGETVGLADTDGATLLDYGDQSLLEVPALDIDANYNNPATQPIDRRPHEQVSVYISLL